MLIPNNSAKLAQGFFGSTYFLGLQSIKLINIFVNMVTGHKAKNCFVIWILSNE